MIDGNLILRKDAAAYTADVLQDYEQSSWVECISQFARFDIVLPRSWLDRVGVGFDRHVVPVAGDSGIVKAPDSDVELVKMLQACNAKSFVVKDLLGTERGRSTARGFNYRSLQNGSFIELVSDGNERSLLELIRFGKSWGFILAGFLHSSGCEQSDCPDVLAVAAFKLDGYLLFSDRLDS